MEYSKEILDFINSPDTVDFVVKENDILSDFIKDNPNIIITQTLMDRYVLSYTNKKYFDQLVTMLGSSTISSVPIILGVDAGDALEKSGIIKIQNQPYLNLRGSEVLLGFVDSGIDYRQPPFIYEDGTSKIRYLYDQSGEGNPPNGFLLGTEYTNEQINVALKSDSPFDIVPQRDTLGHGTFIASVAAGRRVGDFIGAAPDAEIIAVKLRGARQFYRERFCVPINQEFAVEASAVMVGVDYIVGKAFELGRPVAICIGVGTNYGGHDGTSTLEQYLSFVANLPGVCICIANGNESQARHHFQGKLSASNTQQNVDILVGEKAGNICISIWNTVSDRFSVSVRSPSGELVDRVPVRNGAVTVSKLLLEVSTVTVQYSFPLQISGDQLTMVHILNATPGVWTITVHGDILLDGTYHAWLPMTGFVAEGVEFLTPSPHFTVTVPATMTGAICCGAYDSRNDTLYPKSSWGPTRASQLVPDLVAPGVNISGYTPNGIGGMSGTSVATAITTGACALFLQWGVQNNMTLSTNQIRAYLIRGCTKNPDIIYPNTQWGYGMLDLMQSFNMIREM